MISIKFDIYQSRSINEWRLEYRHHHRQQHW